MNSEKEKYIKRVIFVSALVLMGIQILIGIIWMMKNIKTIPIFGDSTEYLNLSETLLLDEYRPVLYPLILRWVQRWGTITSRAYQVWLYLLQTAISFAAVFYGVTVLDRMIFRKRNFAKRRRFFQIFLSLYLITIPMMMFMNLSILTDSLATSMLVLFLSNMILMFAEERLSVGNYILMGIALFVECLLRADRLYSCLLLAVVVFLVKLVKESKERKRVLAAMISICLVVPGITKGIDKMTQTPGINGRIETNLDFILLDRIVWPNMAANYDSFPQEIREVVTLEDAQTFDKHNNNVMYQMAPLVEEKAGKEKAGQMYRKMAAIVFKNQPLKVLGDIGEDILAMTMTPFSSLLNAKGLCDKGDSWNVHCMSTADEPLTVTYNSYYQYTFLILFAFGVLLTMWAGVRKENRNVGKLLRGMLPFWGMGVVFTLWFCIGDGAPPNDRYALIIYTNWSILSAGLLGTWEKE